MNLWMATSNSITQAEVSTWSLTEILIMARTDSPVTLRLLPPF